MVAPVENWWKKGQSGNPAGRPKGALATRLLELRAKAKRMGADPIEVMINEISYLLRKAAKAQTDEERLVHRATAVDVATRLAPYLHPRLAAIELSSDPERPLVVEERQAAMEGAAAKVIEAVNLAGVVVPLPPRNRSG